MYLIVGLGNPGGRYDNTYHNVGFAAVDLVAESMDVAIKKKSCKALIADAFVGGEKVILAKPQTYMNLSGESVRELMDYYKIPMEKLIVMYDDYDLPVGSLRIRPHGSSGTHNGMRNIVSELGSTEFARIRIGIKPLNPVMGIMDYVLSERSRAVKEIMAPALENAAKAAEAFSRGQDMDKIGCAYNINK